MYPKTYELYITLIAVVLIALSCRVQSQDLHFSQYLNAPVLLSPTETGNYHGDWRFINNYRNQWAKIGRPMTTLALAFDQQLYLFNQKLSIGGHYLYDESGNLLLVQQRFMLAAAYHQKIGYQTFRFGLQGGVVQKRLNSGGLSFPDQWDRHQGQFNEDLPTNEILLRKIIYYPDFNVGVSYKTRIWKFEPEFTFAAYHVNRPEESFIFNPNRVGIRKVAYVVAPYRFNSTWSIEPQLFFMWQSKAWDQITGANMVYQLPSNAIKAKNAFAGLALRNSVTRNWDAFIANVGMEFKHLKAAISYDVTVSKLRLANSYSGAVEFSIAYTGISSVLNKRVMPCNRL